MNFKQLKNKFFSPLGAIISPLGAIIIALFSWYLTWVPAFVISNEVIKFTEPVVIKADNCIANKSKYLNVMFDGKIYQKQAVPQKSQGYQIWHFFISNQSYTSEMIKSGKHKIKVGFPGENLSEEYTIEFIKEEPRFVIINPTLRVDAILKIKADNDYANRNMVLHVEYDSILFPDSGIPVGCRGRQIWHFNIQKVQLLPKMKKNGKHKIRLRFPGENFSKEHTIVLLKPLIETLESNNQKKNKNTNPVKKPKSPSLGTKNNLNESNATSHTSKKYFIRRTPLILSDKEIYSRIAIKTTRPKRYYFNSYVDNNNGTITDLASGLMWQKGGSDQYRPFKDAKKYVNALNQSKYRGYNDWYLPTIDELITLLEKKIMMNNIHINPLFSTIQLWCCSSDIRASGGVYYVHFGYGAVLWNSPNDIYYVRAVRQLKEHE